MGRRSVNIADTKSLHERLLDGQEELAEQIIGMLENLAFENRYNLHPRLIRQLGVEEAQTFLSFVGLKDTTAVRSLGRKRMQDGLGEQTLLAIGNHLRRFCRKHLVPDTFQLVHMSLDAVDEYMANYLEGYLTGLEAQILQDQEQMRRALSAALESSRRELRIKDHAMNTSITGIMLTDMAGMITYVNPAFLSMWRFGDIHEVLEKSCIEVLNVEDPQDVVMAMSEKKHQGWRGEIKARSKDGLDFDVEVSISFIKDPSNNPIGVMASFVDITERKRLEADFREAQKTEAIGTLASGIAHDFNNLLTTIQGHTSLMLLETDSHHPHYDRLKSIEKQVQSGSKLTSQLLGYARKGRYEIKPLDLNKLVEDTCGAFERTRKDLTCHLDLIGGLRAIEADAGQIEQVLLNLYINAADAMPGGGNLYIRTQNVPRDRLKTAMIRSRDNDYVLLTVADTGSGIDPDILERIFDPFFTTKEMGRGTGLGLAVVYGIVKGHDGFIEVDSRRGSGTVFRIYLPASELDVPRQAKALEQAVRGCETILCVDDEEMVLEVAVDLLSALGYKVIGARSGIEAVEIYSKKQDDIHLVILDMVMPVMGGGETYDTLRSIDPDVKVLLSSGYSIEGQATDIMNRGCNGFIQKPFNLGMLSRKIREILDDIEDTTAPL